MPGDWKTAAQIEEDIAAGVVPSLQELVLELWKRVDELSERLNRMQRRIDGDE